MCRFTSRSNQITYEDTTIEYYVAARPMLRAVIKDLYLYFDLVILTLGDSQVPQ